MPSNIAILLLEDFLGLSVFGPADMFETANRISKEKGDEVAPFRVRTYTLDGKAVRSSNGILVFPDGVIEEMQEPDVLLLPGIGTATAPQYSTQFAQRTKLLQELQRLSQAETIIAASCTGTFLLAASGLLDGKKATTTWWTQKEFSSTYPQIDLLGDEILVDEGNVITSAAGTSSLDLALHLINRLEGPALSRLCARFMVIEENRRSQQPFVIPWHEKTRDEIIERADQWVQNNLSSQKAKAKDLADFLGMSARSLLRHFQKELSLSPQQFILNIRTERAKSQLEYTNTPITQVAVALGFSDENSFRRSFLAQVGISPAQYRQKFRR
ncbi:helix-turn-helix domain-containing protein [Pseudovibrio sp. Tun.PSC04-5.I4]|uniref:GlxA family transcriptional regulator n=1 Tax=Pseudovibrio sp. Tun.PSC04-5.I4 TaxID=1798213 RepID=UPI00088123AD|nr:helix-turn-helix domain-containing protein [Pseudovibrio sp. Tun.PSC04-5.I4]SDR21111.1 Transcriptional regulator GlxA family, contains an amidase domain and an AraC-type DNA-binding HTH domain [Pseudovibrio sp. Tun.PSC04-5.I4]